jgi:PEP-CTERM motif
MNSKRIVGRFRVVVLALFLTAVVGFGPTDPAFAQATLGGDVTLNMSEHGLFDLFGDYIPGSNWYSYLSGIANLTLVLDAPVMDIGLQPGLSGWHFWNDPTIWGPNPLVNVTDAVSLDIAASSWLTGAPGVLRSIGPIDVLAGHGPTQTTLTATYALSSVAPSLEDWCPSFPASAVVKFNVGLGADADITMDSAVELESLSLSSGASLFGHSGMVVHQDVNNDSGCTLLELQGQIVGTLYNFGHATITGSLNLGWLYNHGAVTLSGQMQSPSGLRNAGLFTFASGGWTLPGPMVNGNEAEFELKGGSISASNALDNQGVFRWYSGSIDGAGYAHNSAVPMEILDGGAKSLMVSFTNRDQIDHNSVEDVRIYGVLNNEAGGRIELNSTGGIAGNSSGAAEDFNNRGTLVKTGTGTATISAEFVNDGGTIDVQGGTLSFAAHTPDFHEGTYRLSNGAKLEFDHIDGVNIHNDIVFEGQGTILPTALVAQAPLSITFAPGVTYDANRFELFFPLYVALGLTDGDVTLTGDVPWKQGFWYGTLNLTSGSRIEVLDAGIELPYFGNWETKYISGTFNNHGLIDHNSVENVRIYGVLNNEAGGRIELNSTGGIAGNSSSPAEDFNNRGTLVKTGPGTATIFDMFFTNDGGMIDVQGGTLSFVSMRPQFYDGTYRLSNGATLDFSSDYSGVDIYNDIVFEGQGTVLPSLNAHGDAISITFAPGVTFDADFNGTLIGTSSAVTLTGDVLWKQGHWSGGLLTLTSGSRIEVLDGGVKLFYGTFNNHGLIEHNSVEDVNINGVLNNEVDGRIELNSTGAAWGSANDDVLNNRGTLVKTGAGTATIATEFVNDGGTIDVQGGTLSFAARAPDFHEGTYRLSNGAKLEFDHITISGENIHSVHIHNDIVFEGQGTILPTRLVAQAPISITFAPGVTFDANLDGTLIAPLGVAVVTLTGDVPWKQGTWQGPLNLTSGSRIEVLDGGTKTTFSGFGPFNNHGLIEHNSAEDVNIHGVLNNEVDGRIELNSTGGIAEGSALDPDSLNNRGTLVKTGAGTATISTDFLNDGGLVDVQGGTLRFTTYQPEFHGGSIAIHGGASLSSDVHWFRLTNTTLGGGGTVGAGVLMFGGVVTPGSSPGTLHLMGDLETDSATRFLFEVGADADLLAIDGHLDLAGIFELVVLSEATFSAGDEFELMTFASHEGMFDEVIMQQTLDGRDAFAWSLDEDGLYVTALADASEVIPEPATLGILGLGLAAMAARRRRQSTP